MATYAQIDRVTPGPEGDLIVTGHCACGAPLDSQSCQGGPHAHLSAWDTDEQEYTCPACFTHYRVRIRQEVVVELVAPIGGAKKGERDGTA